MRKISLPAPILKFVPEPVSREWLAKLREQEVMLLLTLAAAMLVANSGCNGISMSIGLRCSFFA
jgi:hypothetical protein